MSRPERFNVLLVAPPANRQTPFANVIDSLVWGLGELGYEASWSVNTWREDARQIVLCPHLLSDQALLALPPETILYNLEQIDPQSSLPPERLAAFRNCQRWDCSPSNIALWQRHGMAAAHLQVGWYPGMERVVPSPEKDIDVLFFGALSPRRQAVIEAVARRGLRTHVTQGVFGEALDQLVARAKIALNIHFLPVGLLETMRLSYLLANGVPVVSEGTAVTEIPDAYKHAVCWSSYENLADSCAALLGDGEELNRLAASGKQAMRDSSTALLLGRLLPRAAARPVETLPPVARVGRIPPILHFVWVGDPTARPDACIDSWRKHHPDMEIRIWDNEALAGRQWRNARHIQQMWGRELAGVADLMRWEILHAEGGIALDADSICVRPLPDWLFDCEMFSCWENELARPGLIATGAVGSVAGNPFLFRLIEDIHAEAAPNDRMAWQFSGPLRLTETHRRYGYANLTILPSHFFLPQHYSGIRYTGRGPVYAEQQWHSTKRLLPQPNAEMPGGERR